MRVINHVKNTRIILLIQIISYFIVLILLSSLIAIILTNTIWSSFIYLFHIVSQLACVFVILCIFGVVWISNDYTDISEHHRILAFGLLAVAILDSLHLATLNTSFLSDISVRHYLEARFMESAVLFLATFRFIQKKLHNKYALLFISIFTTATILLIGRFPISWPTLYVENVFTSYTSMLQTLVIFIYLLAFISLVYQYVRYTVCDRYIILSTLFFMSSGLSFMNLTNPLSFFIVLGYILKFIAYFLLFKAIFITSIVHPYKALKLSKSNLNEILNKLPIGIINFDKNSVLTFANQHALNLFECNFSQIYKLTRDQFSMKFKIVDNIFDHKLKLLKTAKNNDLIFNSSDIYFDNGMISTIIDAKHEQQLNKFDLYTYTILNSIDNLILLLDTDDHIIDCNNALTECLEMDRESIIGLNIHDFNNKIQLMYKDGSYLDAANNKDKNLEYTLTTPNGNRKSIVSQYNSITNVYGEVIGAVSIAADLTDFKKEYSNLQNQERLALIGQMGSGIVHETKNYLSSIKGYCELLLLSLRDERQKGYASKIQFIANDMNGLISEYLNLSKPSQIILDVLSLNELIESTRYILESPSFIAGSTLDIDLCQSDKDVLADESQLKHVIINLAKNSVEAMKEVDHAHLIIKTVVKDNNMQVIISDNGIGISPENLKKIGTPFFTTKKTGTGLGLSSCYK
ncbi:PAS domain-containing protein, partial [Alkalibaculum sp. M08DMB]|nr:PAS domain-containing protein [Alkalibaculum sporogenes]